MKTIQNYLSRIANMKTRRILLQLDDRVLRDAGISRELLEQGVSAWPWRVEGNDDTPLKIVVKNDLNSKVQSVEPETTGPDTAGPAGNFKHAA